MSGTAASPWRPLQRLAAWISDLRLAEYVDEALRLVDLRIEELAAGMGMDKRTVYRRMGELQVVGAVVLAEGRKREWRAV